METLFLWTGAKANAGRLWWVPVPNSLYPSTKPAISQYGTRISRDTFLNPGTQLFPPHPTPKVMPSSVSPSPLQHCPTSSLLPSHRRALQLKTSIPFPFPAWHRRGNFVLLVGVFLPAFLFFFIIFLLLYAWMVSKAACPRFHLRPAIPEERRRSKPLCEIWLVCRVACHRGMEVITREFPQIGGCCGVVPGSFGFLIKL